MTRKEAERQEAIERLREWVKPGDTIYCVLRSVSRSGMSRVIDLKVIRSEPEADKNNKGDVCPTCSANVRCGGCQSFIQSKPHMYHIGYNVALALGYPYDRQQEGIRIGGCGMDMGFALVHDLSYRLWPEGFECLGNNCPSNDHTNYRGNRSTEPRGKGVVHNESGYALNHSWI